MATTCQYFTNKLFNIARHICDVHITDSMKLAHKAWVSDWLLYLVEWDPRSADDWEGGALALAAAQFKCNSLSFEGHCTCHHTALHQATASGIYVPSKGLNMSWGFCIGLLIMAACKVSYYRYACVIFLYSRLFRGQPVSESVTTLLYNSSLIYPMSSHN